MDPMLDDLALVEHFGVAGAAERRAEAERVYARGRNELARLEAMSPGPELAAALVEARTLPMDVETRIGMVGCWARLDAWVQSERMAAVADAAGQPDPRSDAWVVADIAATLHVSEVTTGRELTLTRRVSDNLPQTWEAMHAGCIGLAHLRAIDGPTGELTPEQARTVEERVLPKALERGWAPSEIRDAARREVLRIDPDGAEERARRAKVKRSDVKYYSDDDDMGALIACGDAWVTRQMMDEINRRADALRRAGDPRGLGELRVACLAELVLRDVPQARTGNADLVPSPENARPRTTPKRAQAFVTIDLPTLLGLANNPGEVAGHGPINASLARRIAADARLRLLVLGATDGKPVSLGRTSYELSEEMRRWIETRDRECIFPGCRRRAVYCDADHCEEYDAGGETSCENCGLLCRRHHNFKTSKAWDYIRHEDDSVTWFSPYGHTFRVKPRPYEWDGFDDDPPTEDLAEGDAEPDLDALLMRDPGPPDVDIPLPQPPPAVDDDELDDDEWNRFWLRLPFPRATSLAG